jgi:hypothetical protein
VRLLRLTSSKTILTHRAMNFAYKLCVAISSLLLCAAPVMACALPATAMTRAERECCKHMAHECGKSGMPQSHSCCQPATASDHQPVLNSSPDRTSKHATQLLHVLPEMPTIITVNSLNLAPRVLDIHSPPSSPPASISVLRI